MRSMAVSFFFLLGEERKSAVCPRVFSIASGAWAFASGGSPRGVFFIVFLGVGVVLGSYGWFLRGFLGVFSVRPSAFFSPCGWLARLAVWPSVLCVLVPVWLFGVAPLLPYRVGSVVGSLVWLAWSGSAVAIFLAFFYRRIGCFYRRLGCFCLHIVGFFLANVSFFSYLCTIEISNIHPFNYVHYG